MMTMKDQLLTLSNSYSEARRISMARVSTLIFNGGHVLARIAAGGDLTTGSFERALRWFSAHWPPDVPWPEGVPRPPLDPPEAAA